MLFRSHAGEPADYVKQIQKWRTQEEADLKKEDGWLSVSGLFWLSEGPNRIGTHPHSTVLLPAADGPAFAGTITLSGGKPSIQLEPGVHATLAGKPITAHELKTDIGGGPDKVRMGAITLTVIVRGKRIGVRMYDNKCKTKADYKGMKWYAVDKNYRVAAIFIPYNPPKKITITSIIGDIEDELSPGYVEFTLHGAACRLEAQKSAAGLFFNFHDLTSGKETYGAGRFLTTNSPVNGKVTLDFNQAVNPPCAVTAFATCPLAPKANYLQVRVEAGELTHHPHSN